jgi:hypothetical protein
MKSFEQEKTERTENPDAIGIASVSPCADQFAVSASILVRRSLGGGGCVHLRAIPDSAAVSLRCVLCG